LERGRHARIFTRGYLPHFDMPNQVQSLTFRLADSWSPASQFWQEEYFDRAIRDLAHLEGVMAYIHSNPVKAGLCGEMEDWRWSSYGHSINFSGIV
jgi:hypothetical protein